MVAAVASEEPQIEPKPAHAPTAAMATPPLRWPMNASAALNSAVDMPPSAANCPMSRNSGTTDSDALEKLLNVKVLSWASKGPTLP